MKKINPYIMQKIRRRFFIVVGVVGTLALVVLIAIGLAKQSGSVSTASLLSAPVSLVDHTEGRNDAKVVLIEYSDFQCPACGSYYPIVKALHQEFGDSLLIVYRHFPLRQIHANAETAALAAEAAGKQGKFWEMHNAIFDHQKEWEHDRDAFGTFLSYAGTLGLDTLRLTNDFHSQSVKDKVDRDYESGVAAYIMGTPTFFLNDKKIENPRSYDEFKDIISRAMGSNS